MNWIRSSRCDGGACVEVAYRSACDTANSCVEVGDCCGDILVRDSKNPGQAPLRFTTEEWRAFLAGAKAGEFDPS